MLPEVAMDTAREDLWVTRLLLLFKSTKWKVDKLMFLNLMSQMELVVLGMFMN